VRGLSLFSFPVSVGRDGRLMWGLYGYRRVRLLIKGKAEFGLIPSSHWNQPDWVDEEKATAGRKKLVEEMIIYAGACANFFSSFHCQLTLVL
jgi:Glycolipid 2-alpha-mannosyltransferase